MANFQILIETLSAATIRRGPSPSAITPPHRGHHRSGARFFEDRSAQHSKHVACGGRGAETSSTLIPGSNASAGICSRDIVLQVLDRLLMRCDDPVDQIAHRDDAHYALAFKHRQVAHTARGHQPHTVVN
jgi:hypothetical protein